MNAIAQETTAHPFFMDATPGKRFCLLHAPKQIQPRAAILYAHPFAEEMNKSRRMAALQARAFARAGYAVLLLDLYGCGDSEGEFDEARWEIWKSDLAAAHQWLQQQHPGLATALWGLRLGALLAIDYAQDPALPIERLLLWQPVWRGENFLTQFLRLQLAADMLGANGQSRGTKALRETLAKGESLEIAGYGLAPALATAIDSADANQFAQPGAPRLDILEVGTQSAMPSLPTQRLAEKWRDASIAIETHVVEGPAFWTSPETLECAALIEASLALLQGEGAWA